MVGLIHPGAPSPLHVNTSETLVNLVQRIQAQLISLTGANNALKAQLIEHQIAAEAHHELEVHLQTHIADLSQLNQLLHAQIKEHTLVQILEQEEHALTDALRDTLATAVRSIWVKFWIKFWKMLGVLDLMMVRMSYWSNLTLCERDVLALIVKGMGNQEIADALVISMSTTKSHVSNILARLNVASRTEAIVLVLEHNLTLGAFYIV